MKETKDSRAALCLQFLREIAAHNNREWFQAHRDRYETARAAFESMVEELIARITVFDPFRAIFDRVRLHLSLLSGHTLFARQVTL